MDWEDLGRSTRVKWTFTPADAQWKNGRTEALVKCTKFTMHTTFRTCDMDILDFIEVLKRVSFILNSRPVELILGTYSKEGGAQELDSNLPDSWTCITPNDLLLGDNRVDH